MTHDAVDSLHHSEARQSSAVTTANEDPRRLTGRYIVTTRHRENNIVHEVLEVIDGLLYGEQPQAVDTQVWLRVGETEETVLEDNCSTVLLLRYLAVYGPVRQVARVS